MKINYPHYVAQVDEADCGVAALAMILHNFGSVYPIAKLRDLARTTKQGTTALGLVKAAKHLGLDVIPIQADISLFDDPEITYPLIAHVIKDDLLHYCVVFKADQDYIYVADPDPATKVQKMTRDEFGRLWSGVSLLFSPAKEYTPQKEPLAGLTTMFQQLTNYKKDISGIIIAALLITLISIVGSYYLQLIIDRFIPSKSINGLAILAGSLLVVYVFNSLFNYLRDVILTRLDQKLTSQISLRYIHHVYRLPMRFFSTRKTGEITSRFNDINKIIDALSSTIISMFLDVGVMVIIGIVLSLYDQSLFLTTISTIPIYVIIIYAFNKRFAKLDQEQMESNAQLSSAIIEDLKGVETLKVLQLENIRYKNVEKQFADFLRKNLTYVKTKSFQDAIKMWIQYGLVTIILFQGAILVIQDRLSIGTLMAFNALLAFFVSPLQNIINLQPKLQEAKVANNRLNEVLQVDTEKSDTNSQDQTDLIGPISIQHVDYSYEYSRPILQDIKLQIGCNDKLAIVGLSGSGKSTLAKLLVGFYLPTQGQIEFNQHKTTEINLCDIRQYVHYLPQSPQLFSGTIKDNLLMGLDREVSAEEIDNACKLALIYNDIQEMPLKYETKLDEEATALSGGQKQRLTIARALLTSARVLIFDESTSSLDPITEKRIVENLLSIKDRTMIFIAHRLSIAKKVNKVVVMRDGKIIEQGTHQELLNHHQEYYNL
ncbi:peptide cleavage/export ABC transporter [Limosilactobacillus reuteri]|uniref:peptide cleavage/export ABC transporter n=1 Tax=Limosilactobacillus reuteri TaxID=1598 RepID=UPI00080C6497|nr:peptide cleavage/export ABC transporter [Limosilactobacillus reuteri]ANU52260.1 peptide ABC transporter ATP-binding protein [Limosilactobacillus reuteri]OXE60011.1 peptide ABC transporter ATP-binding protein [Limosilactobacillus reuteri]QQR15538.1 peptide cleavage/export ABC transporter [Limosilactobacillus reuteri]